MIIGKLCTTRSVSTPVGGLCCDGIRFVNYGWNDIGNICHRRFKVLHTRYNPRCSFHLLYKNPSQRAETDSIRGTVQKEAGIVFGP